MTDRELLELAGKAAGIVGSYSETHPELGDDWVDPGVWYTDEYDCTTSWNPLDNDGDALRLATAMDMVISINRVDGYTEASCGYSNTDLVSLKVNHEKDMHAATRRAIVRAAAAIGKGMP